MKIENWIFKRRPVTALVLCCVFGIIASAAHSDVTIDNGDSGTSFTGIWEISGGAGPYGADSVWARDGATYTWAFDSEPAGTYEVLMWWSTWPSRATAINAAITHAGGSDPLVINQQNGGGQWNSLGEYYFEGAGSLTVTAAFGSTVSTCADAVWFRLVSANAPPTAHITSISPNPAIAGQVVTFEGYGEDTDGTVVAHNWASSIDGHLSNAESFATGALSEGTHEITFEVQDDQGQWSQAAVSALTIGATPVEIIIDNRDSNTSKTGIWEVSGAPNAWGVDSVWSRNGARFTWQFNPPRSGNYEVSMWWTTWPSRSTAAPVGIIDVNGTEILYVNQQINGGQWNSLGVYSFSAGVQGSVVLAAQGASPTSYCADAVKFTLIEGDKMPVATIDSITPNPAQTGQSIAFAGHGTDSDGSIVAYRWMSSIDGQLSTAAAFASSALSEGTHQITFAVQDNADQWSQPASQTLVVGGAQPTQVIVDNRDAATSWTGTWELSGGPDPYGADSVFSRDGATFTWYFTPAQSGSYEVSMWWTQWPSRSTAAPVDIVHAGGTNRVLINQQVSGGTWNLLGVYSFSAGVQASVTILAPNGAPTSYCADAVKF
ncbi:MAG: hypothetical protein IH624_05000, partial [Phycisphaerae bacterium]|nr:hypothetical protein [Phycisphaerae bacterium]